MVTAGLGRAALDLKPYADAPMMINGYLTTIVIAMLPPLWHKLMTPKVMAWANEKSGIAAMMQRVSGVRGVAGAGG